MWGGGMNLICPPPPNSPSVFPISSPSSVIFSIIRLCNRAVEYLKKTKIGWKSVFSAQHFTAVTWHPCRVLFLEVPGVLEGLPWHHQKLEKLFIFTIISLARHQYNEKCIRSLVVFFSPLCCYHLTSCRDSYAILC